MRKKHFGEEDVFAFIWNDADDDGIWVGDAATLAAEFGVSEAEAHETLGELCDRNRLQRLDMSKYIITIWRERKERSDEEQGDW